MNDRMKRLMAARGTDEQTMSGNAGGYAVPLGEPLRLGGVKRPDPDDLDTLDIDDEYRALLKRAHEEISRLRVTAGVR